MAFSILALCVVALFTGETTAGGNPGFQARITQRALDYAAEQAINALAAMVPSAHIPDQSGDSGDISYSLTNIRIEGFTKPGASIKLAPNTGLTWTATNAGIKLHSDWHVKYKKGWFKFSTSGSVDASASGISSTVTMAMGADPNGRPSIRAAGCSCSVGGVDISIHGDLKIVFDLFRGLVERKVRDMIPGKLCDVVQDQINTNAESQLQKLKVLTPLMGNRFMLDYRLVTPPTFLTAYMETYHKGLITWAADQQSPPFDPQPLPSSSSSSNMLYLWIGEYLPHSFIYAAQRHGFLTYNLTAKDLPPEDRGFLNTTCTKPQCIGNLVPAIGKLYPGCTLELRMNSTVMPVVKIGPGLLEADFAGDIAFYAHTNNGKIAYLLTLGVSAIFNMTAIIDNQLVKGNITDSSFKVVVVKSDVGQLNDKVINTMVGLTMKFFIIPSMNKQGNLGFPLPVTDNIKFANTQLQLQTGAVMIATDLVYQSG